MEKLHEEDEEEKDISRGFVANIVWRIKKLTAPLLEQSPGPIDIDQEEIEFLERKLKRIRATLKDHARFETSYETVKLWLRELKELELCLEDIIEELLFESVWKPRMRHLRCDLRGTSNDNAGKRKRDEISFLVSSRPGESLHHKIRKIINLYNEIAFDREALSFREGDGMLMQPHHCPRPESTSLTTQKLCDFHGRKTVFDEVISSLIAEPSQECDISIISIVGMAGVGKTSLTQHVFNDKKVCSHFHERIWICMSEGLNEEKTARIIRDNLVKGASSMQSLDLVQKDIAEQLRRKRFLLVLDDLSYEEQLRSFWEVIKTPLTFGAEGSRVIVTTRDRRVANILETKRSFELSCLLDEECWRIVQQHVFGSQQVRPELIQIGKDISKKCKGLPLVAKIIGEYLRIDCNEEQWKKLLQSDFFYVDELWNEIFQVLGLSYEQLPLHVKPCFQYCSLFPKSFTFEKDLLVQLWMAQGFVEPREGSRVEDTGNGYFNELVNRSLVQDHPTEQRFVIHDLFQEVAQYVAGEQCSKTEDHKIEIDKRTRHSSLVLHEFHIEKGIVFELTNGQDLRSFLLIRGNGVHETLFHVCNVDDLFELLHCLRALDLSNTDTEELPVSIGNLIHLRYLSLRNTKIKRLPESMCGLFKLQTLDLRQCVITEDLSVGIKLLSNLQRESSSENINIFPSRLCLLTDHRAGPLFSDGNVHQFTGIGKSVDRQSAVLKGVVAINESEGGLIKRLKKMFRI